MGGTCRGIIAHNKLTKAHRVILQLDSSQTLVFYSLCSKHFCVHQRWCVAVVVVPSRLCTSVSVTHAINLEWPSQENPDGCLLNNINTNLKRSEHELTWSHGIYLYFTFIDLFFISTLIYSFLFSFQTLSER